MCSDTLDSWFQKNKLSLQPEKSSPPSKSSKPPFRKFEKKSDFKPFQKKPSPQGGEIKPQGGHFGHPHQEILKKTGHPETAHPDGKDKKPHRFGRPRYEGSAGHGFSPIRHGKAQHRHSRPQSKNRTPFRSAHHLEKPIAPAAEIKPAPSNILRVIPLGGLDEVGKNMMVVEYGNDIVIIDMGFQFPEEEMLGIDFVIPDISYLKGKEYRIRGILITHGHLDHIGAIPYLIDQLGSPPIYATRLTLELIRKRNSEFDIKNKPKLYEINSDSRINLGTMTAGFFRVNHSIPDCVGVALETPKGIIVHTGDFKFDSTPADGIMADLDKMSHLGTRNVLALFSESTNALLPGHSTSEKDICENIDNLIKNAKHRVVIASFSSLIGRIQHVINSAAKYNRRVYVSGRSMEANIQIAKQLGYLKLPQGTEIHRMRKGGRHIEDQVLILTTGSQGEDISGLSRMAYGEHAHIKIRKGDTVILSSQQIIGNERAVVRVMNELSKRGARVISNQSVNVHISGHGKQEDLKMMINFVKPRYLVPIHGEFYMRTAHKDLGLSVGMKDEHVLLLSNGSIFESDGNSARISDQKIETKYVLVEGLGVGSDSAAQILQERQVLAENGVVVVLMKLRNKELIGFPDVISRGFIFSRESQEILKDLGVKAKDCYYTLVQKDPKVNQYDIRNFVRNRLDTYVYSLTEKRPLIVPVLVNL